MKEGHALERREAVAPRLVSGEWLAGHLDDPDLRIIEVSSAPDDAEYRQGHIPGALRWYWKDALWHATNREFATPEDMASCLGRSGIAPDTTIVVYGRPVQYGTYALWVLTMAGHQDVRLLDGCSCGKMGLRCWRVFAQDCDRPFHRVHSLLTRETMRHSRLLSNR
jgi:3-mercaptopyruvate sulfurtransferase SseA